MQTDTRIVGRRPRNCRKKPPSDADFFGPAEPLLPSQRHPEHFERYKGVFLKDADPTRFSTRRNGDDAWFPARGKQYADGRLIKQWDRPLSSSTRELDGHLAGLKDNGSLSWMGAFGGRYTSKYNADVDNHEAKNKGYYDSGGRWVQVADLSVRYLTLVKIAYEALAKLDRPTIFVTSSRSLGLNIWQHTDRPYWGAEVFKRMTDYLEDRHVNRHLNHLFPDPEGKWKKMEVFPMYGKDGRSNRLQRLPFGHGSFTLTATGIIRPWHEQLDHFLRPGPTPTFEQVVDHLLALYVEQFQDWLSSGRRPSQEEKEHHQCRVEAAENWIKAGCPVEEPPERKPAEKAVTVAASTKSNSASTSAESGHPKTKPDWMSWPREQRVYYLATHGLPDKESLNRSLYLLAAHLLGADRQRIVES